MNGIDGIIIERLGQHGQPVDIGLNRLCLRPRFFLCQGNSAREISLPASGKRLLNIKGAINGFSGYLIGG